MSKRISLSDALDDEPAEKVVDTHPDGRLLKVPLGRIAPNLVNPRTRFGSDDELRALGESLRQRQIQALPVVTRAAYLRLWPERAAGIGNVDVVLVGGERRLRAARAVGLPALQVVIDDDMASSPEGFIDLVVSENVERENFDPIEEAFAIEALAVAFGSGRAVAERYGKSDTWVSHRRLLLHLAPEIQELVRDRELPVEPARALAKLAKDNAWSADAQFAWWEQEQVRRAEATQERKAQRRARIPAPAAVSDGAVPAARRQENAAPFVASGSGVPEAVSSRAGLELTGFSAEKPQPSFSAEKPEPGAGSGQDATTVPALPWNSPRAIARILREHMAPEDYVAVGKLIAEG
ncbi:ParB/RepB/Spo0J family partition protein [Embleya sp. NPDC050493]|uniref:ParB/RepB/Spo0J family partition protein n=1 Tax=Embleya sp. NPDC050493 TaxID=3363989 RepID=UPI0037AB6F88